MGRNGRQATHAPRVVAELLVSLLLLAAAVLLGGAHLSGASANATARSGRVVPRCSTGQLVISLGPYGAGAGHIGVPIRFRNKGRICRMRGYPAVVGLSADGRVVVRPGRTLHGYLGGARRVATITLTTGQTGSAFLEGLNFRIQGLPCHLYRDLLITPPNATHGVRRRARYSFCLPTIHPVVAGSTGTRR